MVLFGAAMITERSIAFISTLHTIGPLYWADQFICEAN